jgi:hypothetical protein
MLLLLLLIHVLAHSEFKIEVILETKSILDVAYGAESKEVQKYITRLLRKEGVASDVLAHERSVLTMSKEDVLKKLSQPDTILSYETFTQTVLSDNAHAQWLAWKRARQFWQTKKKQNG